MRTKKYFFVIFTFVVSTLLNLAPTQAQAGVVWMNLSPATCSVSSMNTAMLAVADSHGSLLNYNSTTSFLATCAINFPQGATVDMIRIWGSNFNDSFPVSVALNYRQYNAQSVNVIGSLSFTGSSYHSMATSVSHTADPGNNAYTLTLAFPNSAAAKIGHIEIRYAIP